MVKLKKIDRIVNVAFKSRYNNMCAAREYTGDDYMNCQRCVFNIDTLDCSTNECEAINRKDNKTVYFEELKEEQPEVEVTLSDDKEKNEAQLDRIRRWCYRDWWWLSRSV